MKRLYFLFFTLLVSILIANASSVDTINIYSDAMHKNIKCVVILPDSYSDSSNHFPVVYLLHGYSGNFSNWITKVPNLKNEVDQWQLIIVCPDGNYSGWYLDSPIDTSMRYETYITKEVPAYIDSHYQTIKDRGARAITGLSMGGHGGLFLGFRHAGFFGACGSMSGVVDINFTKNKYDLIKRIGDTVKYADNWKKYSVMTIIDHYPKDSLAIIFDCGNDDPFAGINRKLHQKMMKLNIPHDYIQRPGNHNWNYWGNAIQYQLLFFRNYFNKMKK
ncbi:MAG: esterase family protein [Bacteroidetes bacterium]|nr:esterase family protein [Bacteroidota bacterium]MBS1930264.1 esterase family protein [Bacteroidota bacterium]